MRWAEPAWLALLILVPLPYLWERSRPRLAWPTLGPFAADRPGPFVRLAGLPTLLLAASIALLAVAMARPQAVGGRTRVAALGVAVVVAIDRSSSMKAADFAATGADPAPIARLDAAKRTLARFIDARPDDLIGVVAFANFPDPTCLPTLDHDFARAAVAGLTTAVGPDDGTNLGDALAWSLETIRKVPATARVIVLMSDGRNDPNTGLAPRPTDPKTAARLCRALGVTLHTIALGGAGALVREAEPRTGLDVVAEVGGPDLAALAEIARLGGGKAFRAGDARALDEVFAEIDTMEKSPFSGTILTRYDERFMPYALAALACLALHRSLRAGRLARLP